jgi:hypothetical protein
MRVEKTLTLNNFSIHIVEDNGDLRVLAHRIVDEQEIRPSGYILGHNALIMEKK